MKSDWLFAVLGGLIGLGFLILLLDVPITAEPARISRGPALAVAWEGSRPEPTIAAEARLMDPSALFLPSPLTAAAKASASSGLAVAFSRLAWREPPELAFHATDLELALRPPVSVPVGPSEALQVHPPGNPALGVGRKDVALEALSGRRGWVEITDMTTEQVVLSQELGVPLRADRLWRPFSFYVSVGADGRVGDPIPAPAPAASAGPEEASAAGPIPAISQPDPNELQAVEKQLDARLTLDHRLAAGFYRISVGP